MMLLSPWKLLFELLVNIDAVTEMDRNLDEGREDRVLVFQLQMMKPENALIFFLPSAESSMPFCLSSTAFMSPTSYNSRTTIRAIFCRFYASGCVF